MEVRAKKKKSRICGDSILFYSRQRTDLLQRSKKRYRFNHNWSDIWFYNINSVFAASDVSASFSIRCIIPSILDVQYI